MSTTSNIAIDLNILVACIWIIFIAYWIISSIHMKKTRIRRNGMLGGWIPRISLLIIILILWMVPYFSRIIVQEIMSLQIIGLAIFIFGIIVAIWARRTLGSNWSSNLEIKQEHELITTGPYRLVRHPIYTGVIIGLMGTFLVFGKLNILILLVIISAGMIARARIEDGLMEKQFPDKYPDYKRRVKSLIPYVF